MRQSRSFAGLAAIAALSLGCEAPRATEPAQPLEAGVVSAAPLQAAAARVLASRGAIADLTARVLPAGDALTASAGLNDAIDAVNRALERDDARALRHALDQADRAVLRAEKARAIDGAELDVIRLTLDDTRRLLVPPPGN